jgi:Ankyrin repeats (3 copies)
MPRILDFVAAFALFVGGVLLFRLLWVSSSDASAALVIACTAAGSFSAGGYWLWFGFILPGLSHSIGGRIILFALCTVLTFLPFAITALYVLDKSYGQWQSATGYSEVTSSIFAVHGGGPGGIPLLLFTMPILGLLGLLLIGVIARTIWLLVNRQRLGFLLTLWLSVLALCAASFLPSDTQYAVATVALKGPGKNWKGLEISAARNDSVLLLDTLLRRGAEVDHSLIVVAARYGSNKVLSRLIDLGVPIDEAFFREKTTALHAAVSARRHSTAELLVRAGARVDILDARGKSPLDYARAPADDRMLTILQRGQKSP